jgi:hypothetical protein
VPWLWTDTLASLLVEVDQVDPGEVLALRERPVAYRLPDDGDPLGLARRIFEDVRRPEEPARRAV